jgi:hypothetical protein
VVADPNLRRSPSDDSPRATFPQLGVESSALCEQLKAPKRNGGKTLAELIHHFSSDPLMLWAWSPGLAVSEVSLKRALASAVPEARAT